MSNRSYVNSKSNYILFVCYRILAKDKNEKWLFLEGFRLINDFFSKPFNDFRLNTSLGRGSLIILLPYIHSNLTPPSVGLRNRK
jgi:hypothetical protein